MRLMILVLLVALTALVVACGQANEADEPSGGGIQVHGHWTVTVTDPDGTVARVHEFDNEFYFKQGTALLTTLLAGGNSVAEHRIRVKRPPNADAWHCAEGTQPTTYTSSIPAVATRDITVVGTPLMLSGGCTITGLSGSGHIDMVNSSFTLTSSYVYCQTNPDICPTSKKAFLTSHKETIPVANGQLVAFNIVFSFE